MGLAKAADSRVPRAVGQGLVVERQQRPGAAKMPFEVTGERTDEQMRPAPAFFAVADRTHPDVDPFEGAEPALDIDQSLVDAYRVFGESRSMGSLVRVTRSRRDAPRLRSLRGLAHSPSACREPPTGSTWPTCAGRCSGLPCVRCAASSDMCVLSGLARDALTRISHQPPAADADLTASAALSATKMLSVLSSTPMRLDSRSPCRRHHLRVLASHPGEKCGLEPCFSGGGQRLTPAQAFFTSYTGL